MIRALIPLQQIGHPKCFDQNSTRPKTLDQAIASAIKMLVRMVGAKKAGPAQPVEPVGRCSTLGTSCISC